MEVAGLPVGQSHLKLKVPSPLLCLEDFFIGLNSFSGDAVSLGLPVPQRSVVALNDIDLGIEFFHLPDDPPSPCEFVTGTERVRIGVVIAHRMVINLITDMDDSIGFVLVFDRR